MGAVILVRRRVHWPGPFVFDRVGLSRNLKAGLSAPDNTGVRLIWGPLHWYGGSVY